MPPLDPEAPAEIDDITAKALEISKAIKQAITRSLPPDLAEARAEHFRRKRETARARWEEKRVKRVAFAKSVHERLLDGYTQGEIVRSTGYDKGRVSVAVAQFWSLPKPARDNRYIVIQISPSEIAALDDLAADMLLSRRSALEKIATAALEEGAAVARRTLQVRRREQ